MILEVRIKRKDRRKVSFFQSGQSAPSLVCSPYSAKGGLGKEGRVLIPSYCFPATMNFTFVLKVKEKEKSLETSPFLTSAFE